MSVFNAGNAENLIKKLANLSINDEAINKDTSISAIRQELQMFVQASDNNASKADTVSITNQSKNLESKLSQYEKQIEELESQMAQKDKEVAEESERIENLALSAKSKSKQLEKEQKNDVSYIVNDVMTSFRRGRIDKDQVSGEIRKRVKDAKNTSLAGEIEIILSTLDNKKTELDSMINNITSLMEQRSALQAKYVSTNSAMNILTKSLSQIGTISSSYTNSDTDSAIPVYSLKKVDVVTDVAQDYSVSNEDCPVNEVKNQTSTLDAIKDKYAQYLTNTKTAGVDTYSSANKATQDLTALMNNQEFLDDMSNSGLTAYDVKKFFSDYFSSANVILDKNTGAISIPYGHDATSKDTYTKLLNFIGAFQTGNANKESSIYYDPTNVESVAQNTIKNDENGNPYNAQLQTLANNYKDILKTFDDNGFTFKESMYALFNPDTGIFKDNGAIEYIIDGNGKPQFIINNAADLETGKFLEEFAQTTKDIWGETPIGYEEAMNGQANRTGEEEAPVKDEVANNTEVNRTDPLSFRTSDSQEYIFAIDRNNDGKFSGPNDFVGASETSTWLDDLKSIDANNDGILTGEELSQLKLLGVEFEDNAQTSETSQTTNLNYTLQSAASMGITEINLNEISEDEVNNDTGKVDVNNAAIFNDKFSFTMNGEEMEATRKDETDSYMQKVYGAAQNKNLEVGFTQDQIDGYVDDSLDEFSAKNSSFEQFMKDSAAVLNVDQIAGDVDESYNQSLTRIEDNTNAQIIQAGNEAQASSSAINWSTLQSEIRSIANQKGVSIDMEQAHGFYVQNGSLSAEDIVNKCIELEDDLKGPDSDSAKLQDEAWNTVLEGYKEGVSITLNEAQELLESGKSQSQIIKQFKDELEEQQRQ